MALEIGRQGYLGLAIESTPGTPEGSPSVFIPFTENTLQDKHEPLLDISSRANRVKDHDAVTGKQWGEGDVAMYLDSINAGYMFKLALGNESKTAVNADVDDHLFYVTTSGNTPTTATLWNYRGAGPSVRQHSYGTVDTMEFEVTNEDIATLTCSFMSSYPSTVSAPTITTTSGTVFTWKDTTVAFGDTPNDALSATPTKLTNFKLTIANGVELQYRTGASTPSVINTGECEVTGEYTLFLEDDTEINRYRNLTKQAMVLTATGAGLPGGTSERMRVTVKKFVIEDQGMAVDLGGVFALTQTFRALWNQDDPGFVDFELRNGKKTTY